MGGQGFRDGSAHLDELVCHAAVNFQIHRDASRSQFVCVQQSLVHQRIAFCQAQPGGGNAVHIGRIQRGKAPVITVCWGADVLVEKPGDAGFVQYKPVAKGMVRTGVLVRCAARVNQQLQRQWQACVARQHGTHSGQCAPCAVSANSQTADIQIQGVRHFKQTLQRIPGVVRSRWEFVLRCQSIVHRDHRAVGGIAQLATQYVMRGNASDGETAAMEIQQRGPWALAEASFARLIQTCRQALSVTGL